MNNPTPAMRQATIMEGVIKRFQDTFIESTVAIPLPKKVWTGIFKIFAIGFLKMSNSLMDAKILTPKEYLEIFANDGMYPPIPKDLYTVIPKEPK